MESIELPKRQWYHVSGPSLDIKIPSSHNASTSQAASMLQCNREYVLHMFSGVPRVIMLDSGIHRQEELNNGSKCSSKLSGLGMENFSLSKVSNNVVYIKGREISIVNIQSDIVNTLIRGTTHWKSVVFNPLDDRCFIAWGNSSLCLWNRSSYEHHILQERSIPSNHSIPLQPPSVNPSDCILVNYPDDIEIFSCNFVGDLIILITSNGCLDVFSSNLSPGEYFRSISSRQIIGPNALLLDVAICPSIKSTDSLKPHNSVVITLLFVEKDVYTVRIYNLPVDPSSSYGDITLKQSINIHVVDENKGSSQHNAHIIGPNWGNYFAIQIFNQLIVCSVCREMLINSMYFFPSRLLETAAFRPPKGTTWLDTGKAKPSENLYRRPIEIFVSNIFGGLESISIPPPLDQDKDYNSPEDASSPEDVFTVNLPSQKASSADTKGGNFTDDYYSVLMANSQKAEKNDLLSNSTPQNKLTSDRSNLITSIFSTLNIEEKQALTDSQPKSADTSSVNPSCSNLNNQINDLIASEFKKLTASLSKEISNSVSSTLDKLLKPIKQDIQSVKSALSGIDKSISEINLHKNSFPKIEESIKELSTSTSEKLTNMDTSISKLVKESRNINEKVIKLNKQCESIGSNHIDEFTRVTADSFGTITNTLNTIQTTVNRLESQINNATSSKPLAFGNSMADNVSRNIASQIEDALNQKCYDRAFAIAISADQSALSQSNKGQIHNGECFVLKLVHKFDPCVWLDYPLPVSHPVLLGISKILSDTLPGLIESINTNNGFSQNNSIADLKSRIIWIKETIHCFEPFNESLTPSDVVQILDEISESMNKCISIINNTNEMNKSINYTAPTCLTDGSILSDITGILRHIRRTTRNVTSGMK